MCVYLGPASNVPRKGGQPPAAVKPHEDYLVPFIV